MLREGPNEADPRAPKIEGILMKMPRSCAAAVEAYCKARELRIFAKFTDF